MALRIRDVWLDYGTAASDRKLLENVSGICWDDPFLWTVSDEGRTLECLEPHGNGFRLHRQIALDELFEGLPGQRKEDEADIESIDVSSGKIWLCGSHCIVRRQINKTKCDIVDPQFRVRKSRRLLGSVTIASALSETDDRTETGIALPFSGKGSLRRRLSTNRYLRPFIDLPSKENGLDIEGLAVVGRKVLLGLRGPTVDSIAIVVELSLGAEGSIKSSSPRLNFLNLDGLGVRDLARSDDGLFVLAGPVTGSRRPFRLYQWRRRATDRIQTPELRYEWPPDGDAPEGICQKDQGLLIGYDLKPNSRRIKGGRVRADWLTGM
jgi:hypothetical protein